MAGQPKRRAMADALEKRTRIYFEDDPVPTQLDYVCCWITDGKTLTDLALELNVARSWLTVHLDKTFGDAVCDQRLTDARAHASHSHAESSMSITDLQAVTTVEVSRNASRSRSRQWLAERWNQQKYGQSKGVNVSINIGDLHLAALQAPRNGVTGTMPGQVAVVESGALLSDSLAPTQRQVAACQSLSVGK